MIFVLVCEKDQLEEELKKRKELKVECEIEKENLIEENDAMKRELTKIKRVEEK